MNPPDLMLSLRDVCLSYHAKRRNYDSGIHHVLNEISLEVRSGETLGIIGRNGCGKSTILRVMASILAPGSGEVWQKPGSTSALLALGLGFKPHLSGRDNAQLAAMLQGASKKMAIGWMEDIKEFSELGDAFEEPVTTYSAGMRARLAFTTSLLTHVDILMIDEILSVGDAKFKSKAEAALKERIAGEQTVVFVSHSGAQIRSVCDRAIWLEDGCIAAEGEPSEVLNLYHEKLMADA